MRAIALPALKIFSTNLVQRYILLAKILALAACVAAVVYELTHSGKPRASAVDNPRLNRVDRTGDIPRAIWKANEFECLGWRATYDCDPNGKRDVTRDRKCDESITHVSGYCEVRNATSGEIFRVMLSTCKSWQWHLVKQLTCNDARQFTDFSIRASEYQHPSAMATALSRAKTARSSSNYNSAAAREMRDTIDESSGVVLIGYPKVIAGVYSIVRMLRFHGCALPIEVWIDPQEMHPTHSVLIELVARYNVSVCVIDDPNATKFHAKPYTIYHSRFQSVLFLDSDNIPVRDPTYLFTSPEFTKFGAVFWPDFWRPPVDTPFNVHQQSALWQLLDMPFIDMFEQESGQILINKTRSAAAMNMLMFYSASVPRLLTEWGLVYGDKDLFRLAWLNTSTPFYYVQHTVALGGLYDKDEDFFCGVAMMQRDPLGEFIFLHRNQAKLSGRRDQKSLLTHYQEFRGEHGLASSPLLERDLNNYRVECKHHRLGQRMCFFLNPKTLDGGATPFSIKSSNGTKHQQAEELAIHFSIEGRRLLSRTEEAEIAALELPKARTNAAWYVLIPSVFLLLLLLVVAWTWVPYHTRYLAQRQRQLQVHRSTVKMKDLENVAANSSLIANFVGRKRHEDHHEC